MPAAPNASRSRQNPPTSKSRMALFNTLRLSIYGVVVLFTVICLAMAGHFQAVLLSSDLTRFVPFAIFVCSASLFIFLVLIFFSVFLRERNPISTKIELSSLALAGIFWLVLGAYLASSDVQSAEVQCFSEQDPDVVLDNEVASFHTDQFQAMYRVLTTFALMNAILILFSCLVLLFLAWRRHRAGDVHMWHGPVTVCAWFNQYDNSAKPSRNKSISGKNLLPVASPVSPNLTEKPERKGSRRDREYPSRSPYGSGGRNPPVPPKSSQPTRYQLRDDQVYAPRSAPRTTDLENGGMMNPYSSTRSPRR